MCVCVCVCVCVFVFTLHTPTYLCKRAYTHTHIHVYILLHHILYIILHSAIFFYGSLFHAIPVTHSHTQTNTHTLCTNVFITEAFFLSLHIIHASLIITRPGSKNLTFNQYLFMEQAILHFNFRWISE